MATTPASDNHDDHCNFKAEISNARTPIAALQESLPKRMQMDSSNINLEIFGKVMQIILKPLRESVFSLFSATVFDLKFVCHLVFVSYCCDNINEKIYLD